MLDHLLALRGLQGDTLPTLLVATSAPGRALAWHTLLDETWRQRGEAPLAACVATWADLRAGRVAPAWRPPPGGWPGDWLVQRVRVRPGQPRPAASPVPRLVGETLAAPAARPHAADGLGPVALRLTAADRALLDFVGRHPFLPVARLAAVLGESVLATRRRRDRLIGQGLLRLVEPGEVGRDAAGQELGELTGEGLALVAAQQGLSLGAAVRANGLAGGGPARPLGARRTLLAHLAHTLGADAVCVALIAAARRRAAAGGDDAVVEWRNATASSHRHVRPDGYGLYRHMGRLYGFFLEYDRGTMSARDYRAKFAGYYAYWSSQRFGQDYDGFPAILVVTTDTAAEERIARAARAAAVGRGAALPLLLTCQWRLEDPRNACGPLGRIWREPDADSGNRRDWPLYLSRAPGPLTEHGG